MNDEAKDFLCPECGAREFSNVIYVTTIPDENRPWSYVLKRITCRQCQSIIPAHLGERWDDLSVEAAHKEWKEIYRDSQPR